MVTGGYSGSRAKQCTLLRPPPSLPGTCLGSSGAWENHREALLLSIPHGEFEPYRSLGDYKF